MSSSFADPLERMMDFELGEELTLVRDMARDFATQELLPRARKHDQQGFVDPEVMTKIGELGLWGLTIPEDFGGAASVPS